MNAPLTPQATPGAAFRSRRDALLKAANAAPVGMGHYESVHLTVVQNKDLLEKLNVGAAAFMGDPSLRPTYDAPTVIIVSCD